jgi:bifunctional non-homologous end joining protein LigD
VAPDRSALSRLKDLCPPAAFPQKAIQPCLPKSAKEPPAGPDWTHEIKHDGFRILARRDGNSVRLYTRNGYNFADRFPRIVEAVKSLPVQSCFIDGEAIVVDSSAADIPTADFGCSSRAPARSIRPVPTGRKDRPSNKRRRGPNANPASLYRRAP